MIKAIWSNVIHVYAWGTYRFNDLNSVKGLYISFTKDWFHDTCNLLCQYDWTTGSCLWILIWIFSALQIIALILCQLYLHAFLCSYLFFISFITYARLRFWFFTSSCRFAALLENLGWPIYGHRQFHYTETELNLTYYIIISNVFSAFLFITIEKTTSFTCFFLQFCPTA